MMVGVTGFEPATSWSRTKRSTKLSYTPVSETATDREFGQGLECVPVDGFGNFGQCVQCFGNLRPGERGSVRDRSGGLNGFEDLIELLVAALFDSRAD